MANKKPPRGYNRRDKPLVHQFGYKFGLELLADLQNSTICTYLNTSSDTVAPDTIEVNTKNSNFAVESGPKICEGSVVNDITIKTNYTLTEQALVTDNIVALKIQDMMIKGCFLDSWDPVDDESALAISDILEVTPNATKKRTNPKFSVDLDNSLTHPMGTVVDTEVFGDWALTADTTMESVAFNADNFFDALSYGSIGHKMSTVVDTLRNKILTKHKPSYQSYMKKFVPSQCRFGRDYLFMGELIHIPIYTDINQLGDPFVAPTTGNTVIVTKQVFFDEWNPDFNQQR